MELDKANLLYLSCDEMAVRSKRAWYAGMNILLLDHWGDLKKILRRGDFKRLWRGDFKRVFFFDFLTIFFLTF